MGTKENDSKGEERENGKVRTSFALTQFLEIVEALNKANIGIAKLSYRYDVDEERRLVASSVQQKLRWYPNRGGSNCCAVSIENPQAVNICYNILKDIEWLGFADFDFIGNPQTGELLVMEINPRLPACVKGSIVAGIDWGEIIVNGYLGLPQKKYNYKTGVYLRHLGLDILWFLHAEDRWNTNPNWFCFLGSNLYYQDMNGWRDPMPFIKGTWHNVKKLFNPEFKKAKSQK